MITFTLPQNSKLQPGQVNPMLLDTNTFASLKACDDLSWHKQSFSWSEEAKKKMTLGTRGVHNYTMSKDVTYIKPKARVY
jgi:hypothetical protein